MTNSMTTTKIIEELDRLYKENPNPSTDELLKFYDAIEEHVLMELGSETKDARNAITSLSEQLVMHALLVLRFKSIPRYAPTVEKWRKEIAKSFLSRIPRITHRIKNFSEKDYNIYLSDALSFDVLYLFNDLLESKDLAGYCLDDAGLNALLPPLESFLLACSSLLAQNQNPSIHDLIQIVNNL